MAGLDFQDRDLARPGPSMGAGAVFLLPGRFALDREIQRLFCAKNHSKPNKNRPNANLISFRTGFVPGARPPTASPSYHRRVARKVPASSFRLRKTSWTAVWARMYTTGNIVLIYYVTGAPVTEGPACHALVWRGAGRARDRNWTQFKMP